MKHENFARRFGYRHVKFAAVAVGFWMLTTTAAVKAEDLKVTIDNFSFTPAVLTVKPGTRVIFENHDDIPHSVVSVDGKFRSKALDTDESFAFTFTTAGDVDYFCGLHPHMKGKIIVTPEKS